VRWILKNTIFPHFIKISYMIPRTGIFYNGFVHDFVKIFSNFSISFYT